MPILLKQPLDKKITMDYYQFVKYSLGQKYSKINS